MTFICKLQGFLYIWNRLYRYRLHQRSIPHSLHLSKRHGEMKGVITTFILYPPSSRWAVSAESVSVRNDSCLLLSPSSISIQNLFLITHYVSIPTKQTIWNVNVRSLTQVSFHSNHRLHRGPGVPVPALHPRQATLGLGVRKKKPRTRAGEYWGQVSSVRWGLWVGLCLCALYRLILHP